MVVRNFRPHVLIALVVLLISLFPATSSAQSYPFMVYTNPNYAGSMCYSDAPMTANIYSSCNDQISSILLASGWSVRLYRDQNQGGPSFCLNRNDADLTDNTFEDGSAANDAISSFILYNQPWCGGSPTPAYPLEVFNDPGYAGTRCYSGAPITANIHSTCNDQISSILLRAGWSVRVYRDQNQQGPSRCLTVSDSNLADNAFIDGSKMDNAISSFRLVNGENCANQAPRAPTLLEPAGNAIINNQTVTLRVQDAGDPDNGPRGSRDFHFRIERTDGGWSQESPWTGNTWQVTVPNTGYYRWRAQSGDGELASAWSSWANLTISVAIPVPQQPIPPDPGPKDWPVPYYSQGDPQWGSNRIGACNNNIANVGCALTSLAMIYRYYGVDHTPGTLNRCLGSAACPLGWASSQVSACSGGKVRWVSWPAFSYTRLQQELAKAPVILELRKGNEQHFVVVVGGSGNSPGGYIVNDPGIRNGARTTLSSTLAIFKGFIPHAMRIYTGTPALTAELVGSSNDLLAPLHSPQPSIGEVITGTLALNRNTETEMVLELAAQSNAGAVSEIRVWTEQHPNTVWQPFANFVSAPLDTTFYIQYRDAAGNTTPVIGAGIPVAPDTVEQPLNQQFLPMLIR